MTKISVSKSNKRSRRAKQASPGEEDAARAPGREVAKGPVVTSSRRRALAPSPSSGVSVSAADQFDVLVIGGGICAALTALAAASAGPTRSKRVGPGLKKLTVGWVRTDPHRCGDIAAATYAILNPAAAELSAGLKGRLPGLTAGSFKGLQIKTAREGRQAEFIGRTTSGLVCDGPAMLDELTRLVERAGVRIIPAAEPARLLADDHGVIASPSSRGPCRGKVALLTDPEIIQSGLAESLGFRQHWLAGRSYPCAGQTFAASAELLDEAFGKTRRPITIWQLASLDNEPGGASDLTSPSGHDGHAWVLPKNDAVSVGLISTRPIANSGPRPDPAAMLAGAIGELRAINALPRQLGPAIGPVAGWQLPVAAALELESHVGKRSLAVGLAGGFVAALSGQWLYPTIAAAAVAAGIVRKAIADPRPQDVLAHFGARWRGEFADYLRSPNTRLAFLLPLAFGNPHIAARFSRAYLFGETF